MREIPVLSVTGICGKVTTKMLDRAIRFKAQEFLLALAQPPAGSESDLAARSALRLRRDGQESTSPISQACPNTSSDRIRVLDVSPVGSP